MKYLLNQFSNILNLEIYSGTSINITIGTFVFIFIIILLVHWSLRLLKKTLLKFTPPEDEGKFKTVFNFVNYFIYTIIFFFILNSIGINISMFLTTTAAIFVGLGFALQKIFQDFIAGVYIMFDKTIHIGDVIEIDGKVARIKQIKLRATIAETRNRRIIVIPNHKFIDNILNNWTQDGEMIRASIDVGVYIGTDLQLVKEALLSCAKKHEEVLKDPEPIVMIDSFGESSIRFLLHYFIDNPFDNDRISSDLRFEIDRQFKSKGIKLPVPVLRMERKEIDAI